VGLGVGVLAGSGLDVVVGIGEIGFGVGVEGARTGVGAMSTVGVGVISTVGVGMAPTVGIGPAAAVGETAGVGGTDVGTIGQVRPG
jgi:hypothetical protein